MNNGLVFLLTTVFIYFKISFQKSPEYAKMQFHMTMLLDVLIRLHGQDKIFYPRVKSQISLSGVQEKLFLFLQNIFSYNTKKVLPDG